MKAMHRRELGVLIAAMGLALCTACAQRPIARAVSALPLLRLPPAQLTREFSLSQRLAVSRLDAPDLPAQQVDVQFELDRESLRMAGFALSQRVLLVQWDGQHLQVERHPRLPQEVDVTRVLRDMTLLYWPVDELRAALPLSWTLEQGAQQRRLLEAGAERLVLSWQGDLAGDSRIEIVNAVERYRLDIESHPAGLLP